MSLDLGIRNPCTRLNSRTYLYELYFTDPGDFFSDDAFCDIWKSHLIIMAVALLIFSLIYFVTRKNRRLMATGNRFHKDIVPEKCGPDIPKKMLELIKKGVETSYTIGQDAQQQRKREWLTRRNGDTIALSQHHPPPTIQPPPPTTTALAREQEQERGGRNQLLSYRDVVANMATLDSDTDTDNNNTGNNRNTNTNNNNNSNNNNSSNNNSSSINNNNNNSSNLVDVVVDEDTPLEDELPSRIYSAAPLAMVVPPPQGIGQALEDISETSDSNNPTTNNTTTNTTNNNTNITTNATKASNINTTTTNINTNNPNANTNPQPTPFITLGYDVADEYV